MVAYQGHLVGHPGDEMNRRGTPALIALTCVAATCDLGTSKIDDQTFHNSSTQIERGTNGLEEIEGMLFFEIKGVAAAAVKDDVIVWMDASGKANDTTDATPMTPFQAASISKVVLATALLQGLEQGHYSLDLPVSPLSDVPTINPHTGADPTLRSFASHSAGVKSDYCTVSSFNGADPSADLQLVLGGCFLEEDARSKAEAWNNVSEGTT